MRTCTGPVQWRGSGRLSYEDSVCAVHLHQRAREMTHSSLPSPPPSCAWKLPEMNGPYCDLMRPFAYIRLSCEFIPRLRGVNAQDEPRGLPASSRRLRLMWHEKLGQIQIDHDRGWREPRRPPGGMAVPVADATLSLSVPYRKAISTLWPDRSFFRTTANSDLHPVRVAWQ